MEIFNICEGKAKLFDLVDKAARGAARGEVFIIAEDGKALVKVIALSGVSHEAQDRLGFMAGEIAVPDDFDSMGSGEIEEMFGRSG